MSPIEILIILLLIALGIGGLLAQVARRSKKTAKKGAGTLGGADENFFKTYLWSIVTVVVGVMLLLWGYNTAIQPTDVSSWSRDHRLPLLIFWGIAGILIAIHAKGTTANVLQWVLGTMVIVTIFLGSTLGQWILSPKSLEQQSSSASTPQECSKVHHCISHELDDGSTERVSVPKGKTLCFDKSSWDNREKLGLRSTYQGGPEVMHTCTKDQVLSGTCREPNLDSFRFVPKEEVRIPRHWFVPEGTGC